MPTIEELNEMATLMFGCLWERNPEIGCNIVERREDKTAVMMAVLSAKRNDILGDIVTTMDRIQNDTGAIAQVVWNKS